MSEPDIKWTRETILVVDDTSENIDLLDGVLGNHYNIAAAINGEIALKLLEHKLHPDLILLDIMMPGIDGYEVCLKIKENPRTSHIPVIFITARNEVIDEIRGFEVGGADYITKPISPPILLARVKTHLALAEQRQILQASLLKKDEELESSRLDMLNRLTRTVEYKDNDTGNHIIRIGKYSELLAAGLGLPEEKIRLIALTSPMHDVGKIGVPDAILKKKGPLTPEEWEIMKKHPEYGARIIGNNPGPLFVEARTCALTHHEKWNGKGYPSGLKGEDIPVTGRILSVADFFDAVTSTRPYKAPWNMERVLDVMNGERGKSFDPGIVEVFFNSLPEVKRIMALYAPEENRGRGRIK